MVNCASINCTVRPGEEVSMFSFPKDAKRRKFWLMNMRRDNYSPGKSAKLCERHFTPDQFTMNPETARSCGYARLYLKEDAVPTLFNFDKPDLKRKNKEEVSCNTTKSRKSNAVLKLAAHKTLRDLPTKPIQEVESSDGIVSDVEILPVDHHDQEPLTTSTSISVSTDATATFNAFTQTSNLVQRRHVIVQVDIQVEDAKPTTRNVETQTDMYDVNSNVEENDSSFISICDSEGADPDWCPFEELDISEISNNATTEVSPAKDRKFIVFESCIDSLFKFCRVCGNQLESNKIVRGTLLNVSATCQCGDKVSWFSQPQSGTMALGNLILSGAILFSGSSPVKVLNMFNHAGIEVFTLRTYNNIQSAYLVPAIESVWRSSQLGLLEATKDSGDPLILGGDARCCSPGHTAKYGTYSLMDLSNSKILDIQLVQSNEVKNSYHMELEGLKRGLNYLRENDVAISQLVTDRHSQVKAFMKKEMPNIQHFFDVWHVAKGVYKKLEKKGMKKSCGIITEWSRSISNHMYWCAASSSGDGELVLQKWQSILHHVTNVHSGHGDRFQECQHGPLEDRAWIKQDSIAYRELKSVINGRLLVKDIKKLSPGQQTSGLESFHKVVCHFAPKLVHFFHSQMEARMYLAALHFNENASRQQAVTKDGSPMYSISYPKSRKGEGIAKAVKVQQTFSYVDELMEEVLLHREVHDTYARARQIRTLERVRPCPLSTSTPRRPKHAIVAGHIRRFNIM